MYLRYVQIRNYKNLRSVKFEFQKGANTVIGANDSGKSNAMTALRILLDDEYYYTTKRLKEADFSDALGNWKGHWIIISGYFDEISEEEKKDEVCAEMIPADENTDFLKSFIRCEGFNYGTVTLYIRPIKQIRIALSQAETPEEFEKIREAITLSDYEFYYTTRSQEDFTDDEVYKKIVGDIEKGAYHNPEDDDARLLGNKTNILDIWKHISVVFIDAMRDVESELRKPKNPLRRIFDVIRKDLEDEDKGSIAEKIRDLNETISSIGEITDIGDKVNGKLDEIVGLVYSPEITIESRLRDDIDSLAKYLSVSPAGRDDIDLLGLGHLNILYIALKLVEFEYNRKHEVINIMIIEEPEAHIHTHIQKTLFDSLKVSNDYTQVIMTTHSTHLSEVSEISRISIMKAENLISTVMSPTNGLNEFGKDKLNLKNLSLSTCLERYLDARRSVLLFSKGIILVEGDGEEILFPAMVRKSLGVSLDELGIGLINVGSVAFEYIASIFAPERLQRYCAVITDMDTFVPNTKKSSEKAAKIGSERKKKLLELYEKNPWVQSFYASYTFEVDFANEVGNRLYIKSVIEDNYVKGDVIEKHKSNLSGTLEERYDTVLTVAEHFGKGWYATLLSSTIDDKVSIPDYFIKAIAFASQEVMDKAVLHKMLCYRFEQSKKEEKMDELKGKYKKAHTDTEKEDILNEFCNQFPDSNLAKLVKYRKEL